MSYYYVGTRITYLRAWVSAHLELEHGGPSGRGVGVAQSRQDLGGLRLLEELGDAALDGQLGRARDLAGRGGGHARVQASILGVDVLAKRTWKISITGSLALYIQGSEK